MAKHGFGIIGCGMIAEYHARAIAELPDSRLVAVLDTSTARDKGSRIAGLASGPCSIEHDLNHLLSNPEIDVVGICTPSGAHLDPAVAAATAGKHVVVEKPLEVTLPRCDAIINACDTNSVRLCSIFPSRLTSANLHLKRAIATGRFGRLTLGDTYVKWWRSQQYYDSGGWRGTWALDGGGALMNQAIHNVDLITWLMGEVIEVSAFTETLAHERIEVEDTAVAVLRFTSGALGVIEAATTVYPGLLKRIEIHGNRGSACVEQDEITLWDFQEKLSSDEEVIAGMASRKGGNSGANDPRGIGHEGHRKQLADFLSEIDTGKAASVDGREGRRSVEIIRAIYRSAAIGRSVRLPFDDLD